MHTFYGQVCIVICIHYMDKYVYIYRVYMTLNILTDCVIITWMQDSNGT